MQNLKLFWKVSRACLCLGIVLAALAPLGTEAADSYRLEISDKLNVRVVEWQAADLAFTEWTAVSGDYLIGPDGTVSFPFVGELPAAGKTTAELSHDIGEGLRTTLGLNGAPDVAIEIAAFGPVYVLGDVQSPGTFAFVPGLNVLKAIALAGGQRHGDGTTNGDRDLITLQGAYDVMRDDYLRMLVHRGRLAAELNGKSQIQLPAAIEKASATPPILAAETAEMQAGFDRRGAQLRNLDAQETILTKTVATLEQKRATAQAQLDAARAQLDTVEGLVDQGLAVTTRASALQGNVADFQSRLLDIDSLQLQVQQDISNLADQRNKIDSDQFISNSQASQTLESQIAELEVKMATQQRLIASAGLIATTASGAPGAFTYSYSILRDGQQLTASPTDAVTPGDVVSATLTIHAP